MSPNIIGAPNGTPIDAPLAPAQAPLNAPSPHADSPVDETDQCKIITSDKIIMKKMSQFKYSLLSVNIRSLTKNIHHLRQLVGKLNTDFISLSEIFHPLKSYVRIPGYHDIIMRTRESKLGGGCGLYVKSKYTFTLLDDINNLRLNNIEVLAVKINLGNKKNHSYNNI